jgi:hypothetical protein
MSDVIKAISEYAFVTSPYPVVLSIENHCCFEQQHIMAEMMKDIFNDKLAMPLKNNVNRLMPSPAELRHKILIKGKRLEEERQEEEDDDKSDDDDDDEPSPADAKSSMPRQASTTSAAATTSTKKAKKGGHHAKVHPDLSEITYLGTGKVKAFTPEVSASIPCDMMDGK